MNRPSQRRADPHHPHTFKVAQRNRRRHDRMMDRWHADWEAEQYGGGLNESPSWAVVERIARAMFEAMPHRHPSGRTPDWALQPISIRNVFIRHAHPADFVWSGTPADLAAHLRELHMFARLRADGMERGVPPTDVAVIAAIDAVTGDLAGHDVDVTLCEDGAISLFDAADFGFRRLAPDGSERRT